MSQKMQLQLGMKQQLKMTQQLQQAIKLLQLSRQELIAAIQEEMTDNPTLEEIPESNTEFASLETGEPPQTYDDSPDLNASLRNLDENIAKTDSIDWDTYLNEYQTHTPMLQVRLLFGETDVCCNHMILCSTHGCHNPGIYETNFLYIFYIHPVYLPFQTRTNVFV